MKAGLIDKEKMAKFTVGLLDQQKDEEGDMDDEEYYEKQKGN